MRWPLYAPIVCRIAGLSLTLMLWSVSYANAQVAVFDPGIWIQLVRHLLQAQEQYAVVQRQREIWTRLARPLPSGRQGRYALPATAWATNRGSSDLDQFGLYTILRRGIEAGDSTGAQWRLAVEPLTQYPSTIFSRLTPTQRLQLAREWTHPLSSDGLGTMGIHALAYNRDGHRAASQALDRLSAQLRAGDVGNIAVLQQLLAIDILAAREEHLRNVYVAYLVEDAISEIKRIRDALTQRVNRDIYRRTHGPTTTRQMTADTDRVLRDFWRNRP
jgi:hypothetical protein